MSYKKGSRASKQRFSGNHQKSWLWGRHAILETIKAGRWPILEIFITEECESGDLELMALIGSRELEYEVVVASRIEQLANTNQHQGIAARMGVFEYGSGSDLESIVKNQKQSRPSLFVICDQVQDAFNFGAILRCCDGAGVQAVVIGNHRQSGVTPHVARASAGAVNHVPIIRSANLADTVRWLKTQQIQFAAANEKADLPVWSGDLSKPLGLIVGSEAYGVSEELLGLCQQKIRIPMQGQVNSLNVAVATGIILYEINRQRASALDA